MKARAKHVPRTHRHRCDRVTIGGRAGAKQGRARFGTVARILDVTRRGALVLDPFGGSGTTLIAAERTGRTARLIEFDPLYCDVIVRRFEAYTGKRAKLAATGEAFEDVAQARARGAEVA